MWTNRLIGVLLMLGGAAVLLGFGALIYLQPARYDDVLLRLGMPGVLLLGAAAQLAVLVGGWMLWWAQRARRPGEGRR